MLATLALITVTQLGGTPSDRFAMGERLKRTEVAWMAERNKTIKRQATEPITAAVMGFFSGNSGQACRSLDQAIAKLEERPLLPADALQLRAAKPFAEPGQPLKILLEWSYKPSSVVPVTVASGSQSVRLAPGENGEITVNPFLTNPDLRLSPEVGYLIPVRVNDESRLVYVSFVRNFESRIAKIASSQNASAQFVGRYLQSVQEDPRRQESELPLIQFLFAAEALDEGRQRVVDQDQVYLGRKGNTVFRAQLPRSLRSRVDRAVNVVVAVHGAGGSENMFFEAYGRGRAVSEATRRGWVFISPRAGSSSVQDSLDWVTQDRRLKLGKVFLMGHSMGGGVVLGYGGAPTAIAAFAPAARNIRPELASVPIFLAVGKQELGMLRSGAQSLSTAKNVTFREYDPAEHLMIVPEAIDEAYQFFDKLAK